MTHLHNMNSIAELRISELTLDLRLGPPKEVSQLMKIRFGLITFYQRGFALVHSIGSQFTVEKEIIYRFNVTLTSATVIYCVIKTMLKLMFIEMV